MEKLKELEIKKAKIERRILKFKICLIIMCISFMGFIASTVLWDGALMGLFSFIYSTSMLVFTWD